MEVSITVELYNRITETAIASLHFNTESLEEALNTKAMIESQLPKDWAIR